MEAKGWEVRRIHIVYFLCRMGKAEHPHLIRLNHQNRNGIRLRDVKRWLAEVRGKDMPDSFSWSYRRKYKTEYVWQDLLDDDLITPISDNEYVLKGSEITSYPDTSFIGENSPPSEKNSGNSSNESILLDQTENLTPEKSTAKTIPATAGTTLLAFEVLEDEKNTETDSRVLTKSSTEAGEKIEDSSQSSSPSSVISLDETQEHENHSTKKEEAPPLRRSRLRDLLTYSTSDASDPVVVSTKGQQKGEVNKMERFPATAGTTLLAFEVLDDEKSTETDSTVLKKSSTEAREKIEDSSRSSSPSSVISLDETQEHENHSAKKEEAPPLRRGRLRDLLTCRTSDASDPVVVSTKRQQKGEANKMERLRPEPGTILSQSWSQSQPCSRKRCNNAKSLEKENDPIYKPVAKPNCSQCGKRFKPEKLHKHMQSCPGMTNRAKRREATKTTQTETEDASITTGIAQLSKTNRTQGNPRGLFLSEILRV